MRKRVICFLAMSILFCVASVAQELVPMHNAKGQFGYGIKGSKEFAIKPQWDEAKPFNDKGIAIVRKGKAFGMIDKTGNPIGKPMGYSLITSFDGTDLLLVAEGGSRVEDTSKIKTRHFLSVDGFKGSLCYPIKDAKWGLVRSDGTFLIKPKYQELSNLMGGGFLSVQLKGLLGIVDINGNTIFEPRYTFMSPINNQGVATGYNAKTKKNEFISMDGRILMEDLAGYYQFMNDIDGSLNLVTLDSLLRNRELWQEKDRLMPVTTSGFSWVNSEHPYVVAMKTAKRIKSVKQMKNVVALCGLFDIDGNEIIPFSADQNFPFAPSEGIAVVYGDNQCGFYDLNTKAFTPVESRIYRPFKNGCSLSCSKNNDDYYLVDAKGNRQSDRYDTASAAKDRFIVSKGSKQGLITLGGDEILPVEYMEIRDANDGVFAVKDNTGTLGYLNRDGDVVSPFEYAEGSSFFNGYAVVSKKVSGSVKNLSGVINLKNEVVVPIEYEKTVAGVDKDGNLCVWVKKDGIFNLYNLSDSRLTPTKYVDMDMASFGTITKNALGNFGLIIGNEEIIPCSLGDEDAIDMLYSYMLANNISSVTSLDARSIAIRLNPDRNKFKLNEKIDENFWDF